MPHPVLSGYLPVENGRLFYELIWLYMVRPSGVVAAASVWTTAFGGLCRLG